MAVTPVTPRQVPRGTLRGRTLPSNVSLVFAYCGDVHLDQSAASTRPSLAACWAMAATVGPSHCRDDTREECRARYHKATASQQSMHSDGPGTPDMQNGLPRSGSEELLAVANLSLANGHSSGAAAHPRSSPFGSAACSSSSSESSPDEQQQMHMQPTQPSSPRSNSGPAAEARRNNPGEPLLEDNTNRYTLSPIE